MHRLTFPCLFLATLPLFGQAGVPDPAFRRVPFDQWFKGEQAHIKWSAEVAPPVLSPHQRMLTSIHIKIDGAELAQRRGRGEMAMFIQLRDRDGGLWQTHDGISLRRLEDSVRVNDIEYVQSAFVLPGDYEVSLAIFDTSSHEHAAARRKLHVPGVHGDPLPDAWTGLPAVEFIHAPQAPDSWFLPAVKSHLHLVAHPARPVTVDVLVNLTPSEKFSGTNQSLDRTLSLLIPAMKMFAETDWGDATLRVSLLDLARRRVAFDQERVHDFDWDAAKSAFDDLKPGLVDVKTLENRKYAADFFTGEVARRIDPSAQPGDPPVKPLHVVIVLSSPVAFNPGVERNPIEATPGNGSRVFYIRYHQFTSTVVFRRNGVPGARLNPFGGDEITLNPPPPGSQDDQLAPLLKGVHPELFDVLNPEQFRKALGTILAEVAAL